MAFPEKVSREACARAQPSPPRELLAKLSKFLKFELYSSFSRGGLLYMWKLSSEEYNKKGSEEKLNVDCEGESAKERENSLYVHDQIRNRN